MALLDVFIVILKVFISIFMSIYRKILPLPAKKIEGEIVLVTGAGHGMGRLEAIEFAKLGATVIVVDINEKNNAETADQIRKTGGKAYAYTCDVSDKENIKRLASDVRKEVGDVTILVNNAGVVYVTDILSLTDEKIERTFNVNVLAHFWTIREFLPAMKRKNHGHIVALASIAGLSGSPYFTDYCSSKFACVGLCESLRRELRWQRLNGIHVTTVCPFFVDTGFVRNPKTGGLVNMVFRPEYVVEQLMKGVLHNKPFVHVPDTNGTSLFFRAILPDAAIEHLFDFIDPRADLVDAKKSH